VEEGWAEAVPRNVILIEDMEETMIAEGTCRIKMSRLSVLVD